MSEILESKKDWDRSSPPALYVTSVSDEAMEVRALVSARDPLTAWYLHAEVREELMAYLQELENGRYLPRRRIQPTDAEGSVLNLARPESDDNPDHEDGTGRCLTEEEKAAAAGDPDVTGRTDPRGCGAGRAQERADDDAARQPATMPKNRPATGMAGCNGKPAVAAKAAAG